MPAPRAQGLSETRHSIGTGPAAPQSDASFRQENKGRYFSFFLSAIHGRSELWWGIMNQEPPFWQSVLANLTYVTCTLQLLACKRHLLYAHIIKIVILNCFDFQGNAFQLLDDALGAGGEASFESMVRATLAARLLSWRYFFQWVRHRLDIQSHDVHNSPNNSRHERRFLKREFNDHSLYHQLNANTNTHSTTIWLKRIMGPRLYISGQNLWYCSGIGT